VFSLPPFFFPHSNSASQLDFMAPPGTGQDSIVTLRFGDQLMTVDGFSFSYDPPIVYSVQTYNAPTSGNTLVTFLGLNFGINSGNIDYVTVDNQQCDKPTVLSDNELTCVAPPLPRCDPNHDQCVSTTFKSNIAISVNGLVPSSNNLQCPLFQYDRPRVTRISSPQCLTLTTHRLHQCETQGNRVFTLHGLNFGPSYTSLHVTVGKEHCVVDHHDEFQLTCTLSANMVGAWHAVEVTTDMGSTSQATPIYVTYKPPLLQAYNWTVPSSAHMKESTIFVHGLYFGDPPQESTVVGGSSGAPVTWMTVTVGDRECRHLIHHNHTCLTCNVPEGNGAYNVVRVRVGGQTNMDSDGAIVNYVPTTMGVTPRIVQQNTVVTMHGTGFVNSDRLKCRFVCQNNTGGCEQETIRGTLNTFSQATYLSSTHIQCLSPDQLSHGRWYSVVASIDGVSYGTISSPQTSNVQWGLPPVVTAVDPALGIPGSDIIITGRLLRSSNIVSCQIGNTISKAEWFKDTLVTCRVPTVVTCRNCPVSITNDGQLYSQEQIVFTIVGEPVTVYKGGNIAQQLLPFAWSNDQGGQPISIHGEGFYNSSMVQCNFGITAVHAVYVSPTEVRCVVPPYSPLDRHLPYTNTRSKWVNVSVSNNGISPGESNVSLEYISTCTPGFYCPRHTKVPSMCPEGHFCPFEGMITPIPCPLGTHQPHPQHTYCLPCPSGTYCPITGLTQPWVCPAGTICDVASWRGAKQYNVKTTTTRMVYLDRGLTTTPPPCPVGHSCTSGLDSVDVSFRTNTEACHREFPDLDCHSFCNPESGSPCKCKKEYFCAEGTASAQTTADHSPQKFSPHVPNVCFAGFHCTPGSSVPQGNNECLKGYYCPGYEVDEGKAYPPIRCERGNMCNQRRMTKAFLCPAGTFQSEIKATECLPCTSGFICPPTSAEAQTGLIAPSVCPPGFTCERPLLAFPQDRCPAGYYCEKGRHYGTNASCVADGLLVR
jgi:hypothetical protein